jgi:hypothetical protein
MIVVVILDSNYFANNAIRTPIEFQAALEDEQKVVHVYFL